MRVLVTGVGGFIGSRTARHALESGVEVLGVDCFTSYYDPEVKKRNIATLATDSRFSFVELDLSAANDLEKHATGTVDAVIHLAAQPGVRSSWRGFSDYVRDNITATYNVLEFVASAGVRRVVYASSSSVYGDAQRYPVRETDPTDPVSPYGVSKLAGEKLAMAYSAASSLEVVALRYFTVYGPGQRPDMATHRLIECALTGTPFKMFGDGEQVRDFTFVDDVARANLLGALSELEDGSSAVLNIAGGESCSLLELIGIVEDSTGRPIVLNRSEAERGDVIRTGGSIDRARALLGWSPKVGVRDGVQMQVAWHLSLRT